MLITMRGFQRDSINILASTFTSVHEITTNSIYLQCTQHDLWLAGQQSDRVWARWDRIWRKWTDVRSRNVGSPCRWPKNCWRTTTSGCGSTTDGCSLLGHVTRTSHGEGLRRRATLEISPKTERAGRKIGAESNNTAVRGPGSVQAGRPNEHGCARVVSVCGSETKTREQNTLRFFAVQNDLARLRTLGATQCELFAKNNHEHAG